MCTCIYVVLNGFSRQEEEMYRLLVVNYEERHKELVQENVDMRDCLLTLQRELSALLKQTAEVTTNHTKVKDLEICSLLCMYTFMYVVCLCLLACMLFNSLLLMFVLCFDVTKKVFDLDNTTG